MTAAPRQHTRLGYKAAPRVCPLLPLRAPGVRGARAIPACAGGVVVHSGSGQADTGHVSACSGCGPCYCGGVVWLRGHAREITGFRAPGTPCQPRAHGVKTP